MDFKKIVNDKHASNTTPILITFGFLSKLHYVCRFAAALRDLPVWVFNVVNIDSPDTLPIIFERGLFGIYHDWCESFSSYPRTFDLLHADSLFSKLKERYGKSHL